MIIKTFILFLVFSLFTVKLSAQNYERYKKLTDTTLLSKHLGYEKKVSVFVPIEWQNDSKNKFPLIIVFDSQNKRMHNYMLNTIDYLTSNEQMPSSVIISVESQQRFRYNETQFRVSDPNGLAYENEKFIFDELIPLAEKEYKANRFRILIGHSRYGYFTTSLFASRINDISAVIAISPFFIQKDKDLTDDMAKIYTASPKTTKYYRFGIGNDYPEDFYKMDSVLSNRKPNPMLDIKGYRFKEAHHNTTPALLIGTALYDVFEKWSAIQSKYSLVTQKNLGSKAALAQEIVAHYETGLNFSIGVLNGKGWQFYNEKQYGKAIEAWQVLVDSYPNFSEGYFYIVKAQIELKQNYSKTVKDFKKSLDTSEFYTEKNKQELLLELQELIK